MDNDEVMGAMHGAFSGHRKEAWDRRDKLGFPIGPNDILCSPDTGITGEQYFKAKERGGHALCLVHSGHYFAKPFIGRLRIDYNEGIISTVAPDGGDYLFGLLDWDSWFSSK